MRPAGRLRRIEAVNLLPRQLLICRKVEWLPLRPRQLLKCSEVEWLRLRPRKLLGALQELAFAGSSA